MLAATSLALAYFNYLKFRKLKNSGKIPYIISAHRNIALYVVLSVTSCLAYIFMLAEMV